MLRANIVALKKVWLKTKNYFLPPKKFLKIQPFLKQLGICNRIFIYF
jgi:hypothetical protein